jgi:hypothetical protein
VIRFAEYGVAPKGHARSILNFISQQS